MNLIDMATQATTTIEELNARLGTLSEEHAEVIAAKDAQHAALRTQYDELHAYKTTMESTVSAVLQSGDPAQYEALARDFLTPAQEKERLAKVAQLEELRAQTAALEAELGN